MIRKIIKKHKYLITWGLLLITIIGLFCVSNIVKNETYYSYLGLDSKTIEKIQQTDNKEQIREIVANSSDVTPVMLKEGDSLVQSLFLNTTKLDKFEMCVNTDGMQNELLISIDDESGTTIFSNKYIINPDDSTITINLNSIPYEKLDNLLLKLEVLSSLDNKAMTVYSYKGVGLAINGTPQDGSLLISVEGGFSIYKQKTLLILGVMAAFLITGLILLYKDSKLIKQVSNTIVKTKFIMFAVETATYLLVLFVFLNFFVKYIYLQKIDIILLFLLIILTGMFLSICAFIFEKYKTDLAIIFVLLAIPIGLSFAFFMLPDQIPDEYVHYAKAYLTSNFEINAGNKVNISADYSLFKLRNYNDILPAIFSRSNYDNVTTSLNACAYNFSLYIPSAIGILIAKIFSLSVYFGYYLGRCMNLLVFVFAGYKCIKMIPVAKYIFLIYMLNPMVMHQAASYSVDAIINSLVLLTIAYFIKLWASDGIITNKDIFIICLLMAGVIIGKYAYLPVFGIYLILYKKILKINKKQMLLLLGSLICVVASYVIMSSIPGEIIGVSDQAKLTNAMGVNVPEQVKYILNNPMNVIIMLKDTIIEKFNFYYQSFIGVFGWLTIWLDSKVLALYGITMILSPLVIDETVSLKKGQRFWFTIIGVIGAAIVILGMYLNWTGVGQPITEGVQGRYFTPIVILFLISYSGKRKIIIKRPLHTIVAILIFVNAVSILNITQYFRFAV